MTTETGWQHWTELVLVIAVAAVVYTLVTVCWAKLRGRETKDVVGSIVVATAAAVCVAQAVQHMFLGWS